MSGTVSLGGHKVTAESVFSHHAPCPKCRSSDNLSRYTSGWGICSCGYKDKPPAGIDNQTSRRRDSMAQEVPLLDGEVLSLGKRKLTEETCRKFGYLVGKDGKGNNCQIAPYYSGRNLVAQKVRYPDKTFKFLGKPKDVDLFGQQLWGDGGKLVVITEGELDCMTVSQVQGNKWPVVSLPNGASSAVKSIKKALEWLETYETVVLMFDMDEPGQEAVEECAQLFTPGKCKVASLPYKDANECLQRGQAAAIVNAIWQAKPYRPEGLVGIDEIKQLALEGVSYGLSWCFEELTSATYGRRYGEIYGVGAGTGCGKTDFLTQQIGYDIDTLGIPVGVIFLEQRPIETAKRIAGKIKSKRFHIPHPRKTSGSVESIPQGTEWDQEELSEALTELEGKVTFFDSFGSTDWSLVSSKIRYMAVSQGIRVFYLDHLTAMADTGDEKGSIEQIMKELAGLANALQIIITFVSHLSTPEGKPHEEGGRVMIRHFKGSRAIGFWSFFMFGIERDTQADDPSVREKTTFRILKDRFTGQATGLTIPLGYEKETGRLFVRQQDGEGNSKEAVNCPFSDEEEF
ncbi:MAG: toprim domain-containing protein [Pseudomonadota bacterium]|nr:toprim domain-containing protein [Pseudomonadota bacterium]